MIFIMRFKIFTLCLFVLTIFFINFDHSYVSAESHKLSDKLKKKMKPKNDIQGSSSANDNSKTPTLEKCKKK